LPKKEVAKHGTGLACKKKNKEKGQCDVDTASNFPNLTAVMPTHVIHDKPSLARLEQCYKLQKVDGNPLESSPPPRKPPMIGRPLTLSDIVPHQTPMYI
jgi:hypothetical protein